MPGALQVMRRELVELSRGLRPARRDCQRSEEVIMVLAPKSELRTPTHIIKPHGGARRDRGPASNRKRTRLNSCATACIASPGGIAPMSSAVCEYGACTQTAIHKTHACTQTHTVYTQHTHTHVLTPQVHWRALKLHACTYKTRMQAIAHVHMFHTCTYTKQISHTHTHTHIHTHTHRHRYRHRHRHRHRHTHKQTQTITITPTPAQTNRHKEARATNTPTS
jgi:hypothetical protein